MVSRRGGRGGVGVGLSYGVGLSSGVMGERGGRGSEIPNFFSLQLSAVELNFAFTFHVQ